MRMFLYSVFDSCSGLYDRPFVAVADGAAIRSFGDIAVDAEHPVGVHPEHFSLFRLGEFDDNKGEVLGKDRVCLCTALERVSESRKVVKEAQLDLVESIKE